MEVTMTEEEIQAFSDRLDQFGDGLSPAEQALFAEILTRAASEADVEGHALPHITKPSWPNVRTQIRALVERVLENYASVTPYNVLDPPFLS
jgi:hypothetical protein